MGLSRKVRTGGLKMGISYDRFVIVAIKNRIEYDSLSIKTRWFIINCTIDWKDHSFTSEGIRMEDNYLIGNILHSDLPILHNIPTDCNKHYLDKDYQGRRHLFELGSYRY